MMKTEIKSISGEIYIEAETGKDPDGNMEVYSISSVSLMVGEFGKHFSLDLTDFKNNSGRTVGQVIAANHEKRLVALLSVQR
jgi:hypothetical protein